MVKFYKEAQKALKEGKSLADIRAMPIITSLLKAKFEIPDDQLSRLDELERRMSEEFKGAVARELEVSV